jgi:hypothetical protein
MTVQQLQQLTDNQLYTRLSIVFVGSIEHGQLIAEIERRRSQAQDRDSQAPTATGKGSRTAQRLQIAGLGLSFVRLIPGSFWRFLIAVFDRHISGPIHDLLTAR